MLQTKKIKKKIKKTFLVTSMWGALLMTFVIMFAS